MPTPPITIPIPAPIAPVSTPALSLPCGVKIPSIVLIPNLSFSITIPPFNIFPTKIQKQGAKKTRKSGKTLAQRIAELQKLCPGTLGGS